MGSASEQSNHHPYGVTTVSLGSQLQSCEMWAHYAAGGVSLLATV